MDLTRLKYFTVIAETGSIRKAADILNISAPALSKATKLLESELGVELVHHVGRNIVLTEAGVKVAHRGKDLLQKADLLKSDTEADAKKSTEVVRIATFEVFSTYALSFLKDEFWNNKPLVLHEVLPGELERAIENNHVDLGITYIPVPTPHVDHIKICSIEMGVFTHRDAFPGVPQKELPFVVPVLPISGAPTRVRGLDGWPEDAYPRNILHQVTLMESALELCRQKKVAGYFPTFVVNEHNRRLKSEYELTRRPTPYKGRVCKTDVFIVKRKGVKEETKLIKQLARALRLQTS